MALIEHFKTSENIEIVLWRPEENETELRASMREHFVPYIQELEAIRSPRRRIEFLTVRYLIQLFCGENERYSHNEFGAPVLAGDTFRISVSHTENCVALAWHPTLSIGIDVERFSPQILRVGARFLSKKEMAAICKEREQRDLLLAWSTKESAFKLAGHREIDFRKHLQIDIAALNANTHGNLTVTQTYTQPERQYRIIYRCYPDFVFTLGTEIPINS